ncbi:MAG: sporulation protein YabP [Clostridia bacterium]|nr:sporulation protein YabP [Clostridia bacterium]
MIKDHADEKRTPPPRPHAITLENRQRAGITGVSDVLSFNEQEVVLVTEGGDITLLGENLHIARLNLDDGQLVVEGDIAGIEYGAQPQMRRGGGILSRIFR